MSPLSGRPCTWTCARTRHVPHKHHCHPDASLSPQLRWGAPCRAFACSAAMSPKGVAKRPAGKALLKKPASYYD
eukprot:3734505-Alexandrium_andersonii.AAC.1